ncbi:MAG TPA: NAD(P)-dependent oxidoreductase [Solirubrobacteraceae bacterium]|jgi:3-hydroxyisobutyrate dehydrogenase|nr:NAD(P)-dependent oxidoreductase [Solirubrobacteraceae bacterium]
MATRQTVAVLGAGGIMGFAMARNLAREGYAIRAWNRSREKAEPLAQDGAQICDTPAQAAAGADVILTMVADAGTVIDAMSGDQGALAARLPDGATWLQMSTIGIEGTERCAALAAERGLAFFDAPVLGTKAPAEQGTLVVLASGPEDGRDRVQPIFDVVGARTMWIGEAGAATRLKLAVNTWVLTVLEGTAEVLALAEGLGLDPQLVLDAVKDGPLDIGYMQMKGRAMMAREFEPSFRLRLAAKDAGLVVDAVDLHGLDLPLVTAIRDRLHQGIAEHGEKDMAATYLTSIAAK